MMLEKKKKNRKAICKLCEEVTLAYAGKEQFVQPPQSQASRHSYEGSSERMLYTEANYLGYVCYRLSSCSSEQNHYPDVLTNEYPDNRYYP